jgi:predicted RNase H-like HicB family nuclease
MSRKNVIYTHDEATAIMDMFEDVLSRYSISVPSPEDDERDEDDMTGLYGSTYSDLLDNVEDHLQGLLERHSQETEVIPGVYSEDGYGHAEEEEGR